MRFNLAYAEGFEALTMTAIKHMMEPDGFGEDLSPIMQMWEWHFVEELEHCTAAFDVYDHVCGGYFYRLGRRPVGPVALHELDSTRGGLYAEDTPATEAQRGRVG